MDSRVRLSILVLALLGVPVTALAGHPSNDPGVGYNAEALDQAHAAYLAAHQGYAFAPEGALPGPADFTTRNIGLHPVNVQPPRPYLVYSLKEQGRFRLEVQRMDDLWLALGVGK